MFPLSALLLTEQNKAALASQAAALSGTRRATCSARFVGLAPRNQSGGRLRGTRSVRLRSRRGPRHCEHTALSKHGQGCPQETRTEDAPWGTLKDLFVMPDCTFHSRSPPRRHITATSTRKTSSTFLHRYFGYSSAARAIPPLIHLSRSFTDLTPGVSIYIYINIKIKWKLQISLPSFERFELSVARVFTLAIFASS